MKDILIDAGAVVNVPLLNVNIAADQIIAGDPWADIRDRNVRNFVCGDLGKGARHTADEQWQPKAAMA